MELSPKQRARIENRHRMSIERHGYRVGALFWSSEEIQKTRFEVLSKIIKICSKEQEAFSLLDVGCGFADLSYFLSEQGYQVDYHGIDVSPDMISITTYFSQTAYP